MRDWKRKLKLITLGSERFKQNNRRRQCWWNNKTNYRRQKVHMNMWNKLTFVPSCSQMRLQLLHFHALFKTWLTFQELTSIVSLRRRCWSQENISENRNIQGNQSKDMLIIKDKDYKEIFFLPPNVGITILICLRFLMTGVGKQTPITWLSLAGQRLWRHFCLQCSVSSLSLSVVFSVGLCWNIPAQVTETETGDGSNTRQSHQAQGEQHGFYWKWK